MRDLYGVLILANVSLLHASGYGQGSITNRKLRLGSPQGQHGCLSVVTISPTMGPLTGRYHCYPMQIQSKTIRNPEAVVLIGGLLLAALFAPATGQGQQHRFDLKGDVLGESLATFKAKHTRLHCYDTSDTVVTCKQPDASFAGHNPYIYYEHEGDCLNCGLGAEFFKGRLTFISYNVSNALGYPHESVFDLLTAKFGKPTSHSNDEGYEFAKWERKDETLSLTVTKQEPHPQISVSLERAKSSDGKDI